MKKITLFVLAVLFTSLASYAGDQHPGQFRWNAAEKKKNEIREKNSHVRFYFDDYDLQLLNNTAHVGEMYKYFNHDSEWILNERLTPVYFPDTDRIKEIEYAYSWDWDKDNWSTYRKEGYEWDEQGRMIKFMVYYYDMDDKNWDLDHYYERAFGFRDEEIFYAYWGRDWMTGEFMMMWADKTEETYNDNGHITQRLYSYFNDGQWYEVHKEVYTLNENGAIIETLYYENEDWKGWFPVGKEVYTLNENEEWAEATVFYNAVLLIEPKPIYLYGTGTSAGWDANEALEMTYIGDGEFAILAELRQNGDMIKFISVPGQTIPEWGYEIQDDKYWGSLAYRPTAEDPEVAPIMITNLSPGLYVVFADTLFLEFEIYPYDDWKQIRNNRLQARDQEIEWIPVLKITDVEWFDFSRLKYEQIVFNINEEYEDMWWKDSGKDEINWIKIQKDAYEYNDNGEFILNEYSIWMGDKDQTKEWIPIFRQERGFDQLNNLTLDLYSFFDGNGWVVDGGEKIVYTYNPNESINDLIISYFNWESQIFTEVQRHDMVYAGVYNLNVVINPANGGVVTGHGNHPENTQVTLTAIPATNFKFVNWTHGETVLGTALTLQYTMPGHDVVLTANFQDATSVQDIESKTLRIYPNPANGSINIQTPAMHETAMLQIFSLDGKLISQYTLDQQQELHRLDIQSLSPGVYIVNLRSRNATEITRLVVQ